MNKISKAEFEYYKQKHWELWDWLAKHPIRQKSKWFDLFYTKGANVVNECFACEMSKIIAISQGGHDSLAKCKYCPITNFTSRMCCDGLYDLYRTSRGNEEKRESLAEQIRDLPWDKNNILGYVED